MRKEELLNLTAEEFNANILCQGVEAIRRAASILEIEVSDDRWVATKELYEAWKSLRA